MQDATPPSPSTPSPGMAQNPGDEAFTQAANGIFLPNVPVSHRAEEYDPVRFDLLRTMQAQHFWYRGRHRFLLHALRQAIATFPAPHRTTLATIDLGGGCGGWPAYLQHHAPTLLHELALADSSLRALEEAAPVVGAEVKRYQVDLMALPWAERWDVVFLLDVLEHLPQDRAVLEQIHKALRPGGYLFVTTPAFPALWSYNDDLAHHLRRYTRQTFIELAAATHFELWRSRYFMFLLSPLLLMSRLRPPRLERMTPAQIERHLEQTHSVPPAPLNTILTFLFALESPVGHHLPFPWGTSILGIFRKAA